MKQLEPQSYEGLRAYLTALQLAEKALVDHKTESLQSIRRISHSMYHTTSPKDPKLSQALQDIEKASDEDVGPQVRALLPRLAEISTKADAETMSVLVVEDDAITAHMLQKGLTTPHRVIHAVRTLKEAHAFLAHKDVSIAIVDLVLPDGDGRDLVIRIRENASTSHIPIIVLSARNDEGAKTESFALGADAYFEKPVDPGTLSTAVASMLQRLADRTRQSSRDAVTHLPNRMVFYKAFTRATRLASRTKEPLTIALLDLDRFKSVNDIYGHQMGDRVLKKISQILLQTLRASDLLARWGGEEFAILFPNTDLTQARVALNKALEGLRTQPFATPDGRPFRMTFSGGLTQVEKGTSIEQAINEADRYLYLAKAAGRNHVLSREDRLDNLKRNILLVEDDDFMASLLRRFLEKEGFRIFHARDGKTALALGTQAAFSLITLDVKLPDTDGFELLRRFRQTPGIRHVPTIMLSAAGDEENIVRGFKLGADDYIVKPFSPSEFLARVKRFLEKQA